MAEMSFARYGVVLRRPGMKSVLALGLLVRIPVFSANVLLTVHVVTTLGHSYAAAGLVAAAATIAIAISGPWRGRLLDRHGLRRVVLPSTVISAVCWSVAPFVGYVPLLVLVVVAGLFVIPGFPLTRQAIIALVAPEQRRTAIALDAAVVEVAFMIGPAVTIWAATIWDTRWVLLAVQAVGVLGGILLTVVNPALRGDDEPDSTGIRRRDWFTAPFLAVCLAVLGATIVLSGTDIAIVAEVRATGEPAAIGLVLASWGLGSLVGGLGYGALNRSISTFWLLLALGLVTIPMAFAATVTALAAVAFVAGLLCAPTITASIDQATRLVPPGARGEAMGWHGSFMTAGAALGAPLAGVAIDSGGPAAGFLAVALLGMAIAVVGASGAAVRRRRRRAAAEVRATLGA